MVATPQRSGETYAGIPRESISWYPTIDAARCQADACAQECVSACPQRVYERTADGRAVVARPYDCTVGDISCSVQCPNDAIAFPSQRDLRKLLRELRQSLDI